MVILIAPAEYEEKVLKSGLPVLLDLSAEHRCPPCRELIPELGKLSQTTEGKLQIYKINADGFSPEDRSNHPFLKLALEEKAIKSIPSLFLFSDGQCVSYRSGFMKEQDIRSWIEGEGIKLSTESLKNVPVRPRSPGC
jgi:thioredoxin 1